MFFWIESSAKWLNVNVIQLAIGCLDTKKGIHIGTRILQRLTMDMLSTFHFLPEVTHYQPPRTFIATTTRWTNEAVLSKYMREK